MGKRITLTVLFAQLAVSIFLLASMYVKYDALTELGRLRGPYLELVFAAFLVGAGFMSIVHLWDTRNCRCSEAGAKGITDMNDKKPADPAP